MTAAGSVSRAGLRRIAAWGVFCIVSAAASAAAPAPADAEVLHDSIRAGDQAPRSGGMIGAYGASFVPIGTWADHAYAGRTVGSVTYDEGLDQFGPGFGGAIEVGWKFSGPIMLAFQLQATTLSTGEWEAEAAKHGSEVSSHAAEYAMLLLLSAAVVEDDPWQLDLRCGVGVMHAWGGETLSNPRVSYDYTFLTTSFATRAGVGAGYRISSSVDLALAVDFVWAVPGVRYPNSSAPYLGIAAFLGPRIWFDPQVGA